jgi:hypothetical protein
VGDLDDENSGISQLIAANPTAVRAPEQNTGPNVFYLGAERAVLDPLAAPVRDTYLWAQPDQHRLETSKDLSPEDETAATTLNTAHPRPWGWRVTTYLWAKGVSGGALFVAALAVILGTAWGVVGVIGARVLGAAGAAATGALLVWDLKRPDRFYFLFTKPNHRSWLVLGGYCLLVFGAATTAWFVAGVLGSSSVLAWLSWVVLVPCVLVTGYTAFLFRQAEGRDLWQSGWLFPHLLAQALMVGAGALGFAAWCAGTGTAGVGLVARAIVVGAVLHLAITGVHLGGGHGSRAAAVAARVIVRGRYARRFWLASVAPTALALVLAAVAWNGAAVWAVGVAGLLVQPALLVYESAFIRAGQDVPLS